MKINTFVKPKNVQEAYDLLQQNSKNQIIGGGCWLKNLPKEIETAIDLSFCELGAITETEEWYEIGSTATLRDVEKVTSLVGFFDGILTRSIGEVMGVPFRNIATLGGTVAGKFGFSDILTALLALDTEIHFWHRGSMSLDTYIKSKEHVADILTGIRIKKSEGRGYYYTLKKTANDFPVVNCAITKSIEGYRISIGSRPGIATLAKDAMAYLNNVEVLDDAAINKAITLLVEEITFGTNPRGSKEYRREAIKGLIRRGLEEVNR
ncbi:MAG: FAD binding domain-containing protein [Vallitaleaceae bacterium]|nr:FAD binding domain-containing protein [Vallitaleaceae bacterium]